MESFFKSFDLLQNILKSTPKREQRLVFRRRSTEELVATGIFFLVMAVVLFQLSLITFPLVSIVLTIVTVIVAVVFVRDVDVLTQDEGGNLILRKGWPGLKQKCLIEKRAIDFVGVGRGERFPTRGKPHLVYIQHDGNITAVRHFEVGRDAIVLAKQIRKFIGI